MLDQFQNLKDHGRDQTVASGREGQKGKLWDLEAFPAWVLSSQGSGAQFEYYYTILTFYHVYFPQHYIIHHIKLGLVALEPERWKF